MIILTEKIAIATPPKIAARMSKKNKFQKKKSNRFVLLGSIELVFVSLVVFGCSVLNEGTTGGTKKRCLSTGNGISSCTIGG